MTTRVSDTPKTPDTCCDRKGPPWVLPGGLPFGQTRCKNPCVPHMTVCFEHASKEAMFMLIQSLTKGDKR